MTRNGFSVWTQAQDCCLIVSIAGEMDLANLPVFDEELSKVDVSEAVNHVVFVCPNLTFADSTAIGAMIRTSLGFRDGAVIVGANGLVEKILDITGLTSELPRFSTLDQAFSHLHS